MKIVRTSTGPALVDPKTLQIVLPSDTQVLGEMAVESPQVVNDLVEDVCKMLTESTEYFRTSWKLDKNAVPADAEPVESSHVVESVRQASQALSNLNVLVSRMLRPQEPMSMEPTIAYPPGYTVAVTGVTDADRFVANYYASLDLVADAQLDAVRAGEAEIYVKDENGNPALYTGDLPRS